MKSIHPPIHLLLVEDNEGDIEMTEETLREGAVDCKLSVARDGMEALDFLLKREGFADAPTPKVILLDLNMPRMDGKRLLEMVKGDKNLKHIPVIILTSSNSPTDIKDCYERYASWYVVKPFAAKEFMALVKQIVHFWTSLGQLP